MGKLSSRGYKLDVVEEENSPFGGILSSIKLRCA